MRNSWAGAGSPWAPWASQRARLPATAGQACCPGVLSLFILSATLLSKDGMLRRSVGNLRTDRGALRPSHLHVMFIAGNDRDEWCF